MLSFIIGVLVCAVVGVAIMCLMAVSGKDDEE